MITWPLRQISLSLARGDVGGGGVLSTTSTICRALPRPDIIRRRADTTIVRVIRGHFQPRVVNTGHYCRRQHLHTFLPQRAEESDEDTGKNEDTNRAVVGRWQEERWGGHWSSSRLRKRRCTPRKAQERVSNIRVTINAWIYARRYLYATRHACVLSTGHWRYEQRTKVVFCDWFIAYNCTTSCCCCLLKVGIIVYKIRLNWKLEIQ